jgi:hypothetical protein
MESAFFKDKADELERLINTMPGSGIDVFMPALQKRIQGYQPPQGLWDNRLESLHQQFSSMDHMLFSDIAGTLQVRMKAKLHHHGS